MSAVVYGERGEDPSFFDYLNPELPHDERFDPERLLALPAVEITEKVYWYFLECLPPAFYSGDHFVICEATTSHPDGRVISSSFRHVGSKYFHQYVAIDALAWQKEVG